MLIAEKLKFIKPSPTLEISKKANALKAQGKNIISLSVGEPDFDTPDNIKDKAIIAINQGRTKYTNIDGIVDLKKAVSSKFLRENGLQFNLDEIIVGAGAKQVIYNLFMASLNKGDEVLIPAPYWVSYPDMVALAEGTPQIIGTSFENKFKLTPQQLEQNISEKTKWLILCSPSNPTGVTYTKEELEEFAVVLRKYPNVYIMSDDIYEHIIFDNFTFYTLAQIAPDLKERIFIVNGVSKAYSMTGWRIGYGAGPKNLIDAMAIIQSQSTSNPCSISQYAALEALEGTQDFIKTNAKIFQEKRDLCVKLLQLQKDIEIFAPEGAFYLFPSCRNFFGKKTPAGEVITNDNDFAKYLLEYAEVAVVPGIAFGAEGFFRLSYATSFELLENGCKQIVKACDLLT
ncbi:MAG: pyridoxal phosphate-dependent aminotransferase [Rickettsiaceae bacterium]|nr:pyridoxal phosphate-dependent aminotransferase [Rickettsiaceae bacterium]